MTTRLGGSAGFSVVLGKVCRDVNKGCVRQGWATHQVPPVVGDGQQLIFGDNGPDKTVVESIGGELEVELDVVGGAVLEIDEGLACLEDPLDKIMTWPESEDGVEGGNVAAAGGVDEGVGVAVLDEAALGLWAGELLLVEGEMCGEPGAGVSA